MLLLSVIILISVLIVCYALFVGINFGTGILELLGDEDMKREIRLTTGPEWEVHHLWILLVIAMLYIGFHPIFEAIYDFLYVPIMFLILIIILRAVVLVYRDQVGTETGHHTNIVDSTYRVLSLFAALLIGMVVGSVISGRINPLAHNFYEKYLDSWANLFALSVGLFVCCLFAFQAAVYMIGESRDETSRKKFVRWSKIISVASVASGSLVFVIAELEKLFLIARFYYSPAAIGAVIVATLILPVFWKSLDSDRIWKARILAGMEMVLVLTAWFQVQHPVVVALEYQKDLTFTGTAANDTTLLQLFLGIIAVTAIVGMSLRYLNRLTLKTENGPE